MIVENPILIYLEINNSDILKKFLIFFQKLFIKNKIYKYIYSYFIYYMI